MGGWLLGATRPIQVGAFLSSLITFMMFEAAYYCEIMRAGIQSIPRGQMWAGYALGLSYWQTMGQIVLPQAFRGAIAPLGNVMIALTKNTTVVATIGVAEASYLMKGMIEFRPDLIYVIFGIMAAGFVILTLPLGILFTTFSRRLAVQR